MRKMNKQWLEMRKQLDEVIYGVIYMELYELFKNCFEVCECSNNKKANEVYALMNNALQDAYRYFTHYMYYRDEIQKQDELDY